jgi:hypothetical protein
MPDPAEILADLSTAANGAIAVAVTWHVLMAAVGVALALGWRPSQRRAGQLLAAPLASVALVALAVKNPFNAVVFASLAIAQFALARRGSIEPVRLGPVTATAIGLMMLGLGWIYPHFLGDQGSWLYFCAAPLGVVPCATLYAVVGFALLGATRRAASNVLASAGLFFGIFGVARLGVRLDLGLMIGSAALAALRHPRCYSRPVATKRRPSASQMS